MHIRFNKITIHNFLSIGDASVDLANRGYVLVEGHNNNPADGALSNGSGKSSLWNAICWALTGETIQGLKSNIPNIHGEDGCFVTLEFKVNNDEYKITRYREYAKSKNDLKIEINGEDKSGKGLRESEDLLSQYLPELTSELIGNVIILGQGLPHKFSNNTPAGRKELLETLSRSDFMIQDIKDKLTVRSTELNDKLRREEDEQLKLETTIQLDEKRLTDAQKQLDQLETPDRLQEIYNEWITYGNEAQAQYDDLNKQYGEVSIKATELNNQTVDVSTRMGEVKVRIAEKWDRQISDEKIKSAELQADIRNLTNEITRLESITDVCPTCGQKLPDVHKPDTTEQKQKLSQLKESYDLTNAEVVRLSTLKDREQARAQMEYAQELNTLQIELNRYTQEVNRLRGAMAGAQSEVTKALNNQAAFKARLDSLATTRKGFEDTILSLTQELKELQDQILYNKEGITNTQEHVDVINKINSLVKRDFRGVLLTNVINFIDTKIKLYSSYVFNTQEVKFFLEGNNVNIEYCDKSYENLSGGERQKMDIIIQLAIRDMMCSYLDFSANILVVDECFDGLDAIGCDKILDLISNCVADVESLFIISHHSETLQIPADDTIVIEKDERGISKLVK